MRTETDLLGSRQLPAQALHGIYTLRARENFPLSHRSVNPALIAAYGAVKLACARTNHRLKAWDSDTFAAIEAACSEIMEGKLTDHLGLDALQGGAGTSTNMAVNEVIANRALQILGLKPGDYGRISPLDDINRHQSTNDTFPTALKLAAIWKCRQLEQAVTALVEAFQAKEKETAGIVKLGRTEMQDAVLITLGREMSAYADAFARDRWRIYKCEERLRVVNLGGTAVGTGLGAPRQYIFQAVEELRTITGIGLARAENLVEATQNTDAFVEVSGILNALASNLLKVSGDLRLLSSGPDAGLGEIRLPARQAGSSIMPGKVNPVIPEAVSQAAMQVMGHNQILTQACSLGSLELNPFLPLIADCLLNSLSLLCNSCSILRELCVEGLQANPQRCATHVHNATATVTALVEHIGYKKAQELASLAQRDARSLRDIVLEQNLLSPDEFDQLVLPEAVNRLGGAPSTQS